MALIPYLLLVIAVLCWAGNFIVGRFVHDQIPPVTLAFWRWAVALAILAPFTLPIVRMQWTLVVRHWKLLAVLGVAGVALFHVFVYAALQSTQAINASLFLSTTPVVIVLLSWILFHERVTHRQALGIVVSFLGVLAIIGRGDPNLLLELRLNRGDLWMLGAPPSWALYTVLVKRHPPELHPMALLTTTTVFGLLLLIPLYFWEIGRGAGLELSPVSVAGVVYVALFASVIAYICWNRGVGTVGANRAGLFLHLIPVFSTVLAVIFLGESIRGFHVVGIALIFVGIYLTTTGRATRRPPARG